MSWFDGLSIRTPPSTPPPHQSANLRQCLTCACYSPAQVHFHSRRAEWKCLRGIHEQATPHKRITHPTGQSWIQGRGLGTDGQYLKVTAHGMSARQWQQHRNTWSLWMAFQSLCGMLGHRHAMDCVDISLLHPGHNARGCWGVGLCLVNQINLDA